MGGFVYVDHRELRSGITKCLRELDIDYQVVNNQTLDYSIGAYGIERKTVKDFIASIYDKRLFKQAGELCCSSCRPIIILEGGGLYSAYPNINPNVIRGTLLWLSRIRMPLIRTYSLSDTAQFIRLLSTRHLRRKNRQGASAYQPKPVLSPAKQQALLLAAIKGIGPELAGRLVGRYGSVKSIIESGRDDLGRIRGIGSGKARQIMSVLEGENENR